MHSEQQTPFSRAAMLAVILLVAGTFFRVVRADLAPEALPNFSPLMASALCAAIFLPGWIGLIIPVAALLISDALLNLHDGAPVLSAQLLWTLPGYLVAVTLGWALRGRSGFAPVLAGTFAASLFFFVVTNTGSWLGLSTYPQTLAGWVQAMTTGLPGYPPTWTFFRNSLASDLLFAALFVLVERALASRKAMVLA